MPAFQELTERLISRSRDLASWVSVTISHAWDVFPTPFITSTADTQLRGSCQNAAVRRTSEVSSHREAHAQRPPCRCLLQTQELSSVPLWRLLLPGLGQAGFPESLGQETLFLSAFRSTFLCFQVRNATPSASFLTNSVISFPGGCSQEILEESILGHSLLPSHEHFLGLTLGLPRSSPSFFLAFRLCQEAVSFSTLSLDQVIVYFFKLP